MINRTEGQKHQLSFA